jgi:hypothetical protein
MSILSLRDTIKDTLATDINSLAKTYTHGGRFTEEELKRWAVQAPCAIVCATSVSDYTYEGGQCVAKVDWAIFILTKDAPPVKRDALALTLVEAVLGVVTPLQRWNDTSAHMPEGIKAPNLYSGKLDTTGIALWAVTWSQGYDINSFDASALDDFLTYTATTQLSDNEDVPKADDLVELEGP